jgi:hypothetical protein
MFGRSFLSPRISFCGGVECCHEPSAGHHLRHDRVHGRLLSVGAPKGGPEGYPLVAPEARPPVPGRGRVSAARPFTLDSPFNLRDRLPTPKGHVAQPAHGSPHLIHRVRVSGRLPPRSQNRRLLVLALAVLGGASVTSTTGDRLVPELRPASTKAATSAGSKRMYLPM